MKLLVYLSRLRENLKNFFRNLLRTRTFLAEKREMGYHFTIGRKIAFAFFLVLAFIAFTIGITLQGYNSIIKNLDAANEEASKQAAAGNVRFSISQLIMYANDYIITEKDNYRYMFERQRAKVGNYQKKLREFELSSYELAIADSISANLDSIYVYANQIFAIPRPRSSPEAAVLMEIMDYTFGDAVNSKTTEFFDIVSRTIEEHRIQSALAKEQMLNIIYTASFLGFLISLVVVYLSVKKIAKPIIMVAKAADSIAKGDYSQRPMVPTRDEVGKLARSVSRMAEAIETTYQNLETSKRFTENIVATVPSGLLVIGKNLEVLSVNRSFCELFNVTSLQVVGKTVDTVLQTIGLSKKCRDAIAARMPFRNLECTYSIAGKGELTLNLTLSGIRVAEEEESLLVIDDITERKLAELERKRAEEALRESEERFTAFMDNSPAIAWIKDPATWTFSYINNAFEKVFDITREVISKKTDFDLWPEEVARQLRENDLDVMSSDKTIQAFEDVPLPDGTVHNWLVFKFPLHTPSGKRFLAGTAVDITELKLAEEELRKLSKAVEQGPASVIITDKKGNIEYVNEKFCEVTGYSLEEAIGKKPSIVKSGYHDNKFYKELWNTILSGNLWRGEILNKKKNEELYWESVSISPLVNNEREITHFVTVREDITEKKKMTSDLIAAKEKAETANKLKDAFITNMSHEIRTPLNGILGMTSLIKDIYAQYIKEEDEELFYGIDDSSKRIIRTVDMILNYSRLQAGELPVSPEAIELSSICERSVIEFQTAAKSESLELLFENRCKDSTILADEYSVTQSISNLVDNAIKYTKKGFVKVILYKNSSDEIMLDVKDSGIGMTKEYIEHIFEPYSQEEMGYGRAYEGVGLGLPLVKKFLDLNNAVISVVSKKGEGTAFTINFGLACKPSKGVQAKKVEVSESQQIVAAASASAKGDKHIVLLVEDDEMNKLTTKLFLGNKFKTLTTDSSDEVIEILKSNKVDIILMDVSIRGAKNGLELTTELKSMSEFSAIPIIAVTAHAFESDRKNALAAGCDDYLSKPFTKEDILLKIAKLVS